MEQPDLLVDHITVYIKEIALSLVKTKDSRIYNTKYFRCYDILYNGSVVGHLHKDPIRIYEYEIKHIISIKIENFIPYEGSIASTIKILMDGLKLKFYGYARLDICLDTDENVLTKFREMYYDTSKYWFSGGKKLMVNSTGKADPWTTIGSLKGKKRSLIIYDKTLELLDGKKEYISKVHQQVFGEKDVYRIELRLFRKGFTEYTKDGRDILYIDILRLDDKCYLENIFKQNVEELIDFRIINEHQKNSSRWCKMKFVNLNDSSELLKIRIDRVEGQCNSYMKYMVNRISEDSQNEEYKEIQPYLDKVGIFYKNKFGLVEYLGRK